MNETSEDSSALQAPDMERPTRDEPVGKKKGKGFHKKCHIRVHHRTNRLADPDGRSCKALIDGLVLAGVLRDDSARFVSEVSQSQELVKGDEETVIDIWWEE